MSEKKKNKIIAVEVKNIMMEGFIKLLNEVHEDDSAGVFDHEMMKRTESSIKMNIDKDGCEVGFTGDVAVVINSIFVEVGKLMCNFVSTKLHKLLEHEEGKEELTSDQLIQMASTIFASTIETFEHISEANHGFAKELSKDILTKFLEDHTDIKLNTIQDTKIVTKSDLNDELIN